MEMEASIGLYLDNSISYSIIDVPESVCGLLEVSCIYKQQRYELYDPLHRLKAIYYLVFWCLSVRTFFFIRYQKAFSSSSSPSFSILENTAGSLSVFVIQVPKRYFDKSWMISKQFYYFFTNLTVQRNVVRSNNQGSFRADYRWHYEIFPILSK